MSAPVATAASAAAATAAAAAATAPAAVVHNKRKGFNAATKLKAKNPSLMHVLLVRHAESSNNVLAEQITAELGVNPYGPHGGADVMAEYDRRRTADPGLSPLGVKQADLLPQHPHLEDVRLEQLAAEGRLQIVTSPMQRAILTSLPLLRSINEAAAAAAASASPDAAGDASAAPAAPTPLRATLVADVCEKGGSYRMKRDAAGAAYNEAWGGAGRAELERLWGSTHDASSIHADGWWSTSCPGAEDDAAFEERLQRAEQWIRSEVHRYAADTSRPDYLLVVSHADFIDAILTKILKVHSHGKYVFYSSNTSISHVEFEVNKRADAPQDADPNVVVRVRGTNIKPVNVEAHELAVRHTHPGRDATEAHPQ